MASTASRAYLLFQLICHYVRHNILRNTGGKRVQPRAQWDTNVDKNKRNFFEEGDDFFDIFVVGEQCETFDRRYECSQEERVTKEKRKMRFKRNKVTPSERHTWNENSEEKGRKLKQSHAFKLFGSRSIKASNIKSDFDKPYHKNINAEKVNAEPSRSNEDTIPVRRQSEDR